MSAEAMQFVLHQPDARARERGPLLLMELVSLHLKGREDYFVGGNMFIYYSRQQARDRGFRAALPKEKS